MPSPTNSLSLTHIHIQTHALSLSALRTLLCKRNCSVILLIVALSTFMVGVQSFVSPQAFVHGSNGYGSVGSTITTSKEAMFMADGSSIQVAVDGIDPTAVLSQVLGNFLGSPAVLAIPIFAAFSVATVIAWFIVSYANPTDPDEE